MRDRKDGHVLANDLIHDGVWEVPEVIVPSAIIVFGPIPGCDGQSVDCVKQLTPKRVCGHWASVEIPEECFACLRLCIGQYFNFEAIHRELRRCRTSAQRAACTSPARNSVRRRFTSTRHTSESFASSAVSRLSSSATAKAERSSAGRPRTSSRRCSTRAFTGFSLAPLVPGWVESMDNISVERNHKGCRRSRHSSDQSTPLWSDHVRRYPLTPGSECVASSICPA
jgi:hypothetical protein